MGIFDLYSKRRRREGGDVPDVYQYTDFPNALRVQVVHIWKTAFGDPEAWRNVSELFREIHDVLCREYGVFNLTDRHEPAFQKVANFMLHSQDTERVLDVIELTFRFLDTYVRSRRHEYHGRQNPDDAIAELNIRFREHGLGFQFESGQIVRVDSQVIHAEVVKPALQFLAGKEFKGASQEFLSAHEHYRNGKTKECLNDCLKAFESTMKSICAKRNWPHQPTDTAKSLLDTLFQQELVPNFMQSHFSALRSTLEAGVPTVRNKLGGHGQGVTEIEVPDYIASYALHLTATNILLLAAANKSLK
jgi:AbiJ N-terminal domain 4